jgi:hypothetical protein
MAEFNQEQALRQYSELMKLISAGAYQERDHEGNYGADGIEKEVESLNFEAARRGKEFHWHKDTQQYTLEPISEENKAAFLHVNVEKLIPLLSETAQYLLSMPYESALDKSYRTGLHERIAAVLEQSYLVPVLSEQEQEYQDTRKYMEHFYEGGE